MRERAGGEDPSSLAQSVGWVCKSRRSKSTSEKYPELFWDTSVSDVDLEMEVRAGLFMVEITAKGDFGHTLELAVSLLTEPSFNVLRKYFCACVRI
jgi:hypothetical protein